jgi:hypothetical protein
MLHAGRATVNLFATPRALTRRECLRGESTRRRICRSKCRLPVVLIPKEHEAFRVTRSPRSPRSQEADHADRHRLAHLRCDRVRIAHSRTARGRPDERPGRIRTPVERVAAARVAVTLTAAIVGTLLAAPHRRTSARQPRSPRASGLRASFTWQVQSRPSSPNSQWGNPGESESSRPSHPKLVARTRWSDGADYLRALPHGGRPLRAVPRPRADAISGRVRTPAPLVSLAPAHRRQCCAG